MKQGIAKQLESQEWFIAKDNILLDLDGAVCEYCGGYSGLDVYIKEYHPEISNICNYPRSAFGVLCCSDMRAREQKIKEVVELVSLWSPHELDSLADSLERLNSTQGSRESAVEQMYGLVKRSVPEFV